jgi:hypothetical protein
MFSKGFPVHSVDNFDLDKVSNGVHYVIDSEGWKKVVKNPFFTAIVDEQPDEDLVLETECYSDFELIPRSLLDKICAFFQQVFAQHKSEACAFLLYDNGWDVEIPNQSVSYGSVKYDSPQSPNVVGTIHSHCDFEDFFSGTDDNDDFKFDGLHITVGNIDSVPTFSCSITCSGNRFEFPTNDIIETPVTQFPEGWLNKVTKFAPQPTRVLSPPNAKNSKRASWPPHNLPLDQYEESDDYFNAFLED